MKVIIIYSLCVIMAAILLLILVTSWERKKSACYYLLFTTTLITNLFYLLLSLSKDLEAAVIFNKLTCLDGTFMSFFLVLCICEICKIKIGNKVLFAGFVINSFIFIQLLTSKPILPYYISAKMNTSQGFTYLEREFGPTYYIYIGVVIFYMLAPIGIVFYSLTKSNILSYFYPIVLGICQVLVIALYIIEASLELHFERLPIAYIGTEMVILWILYRTALFEVGDNIQLVQTQDQESGYVVLDRRKRYKSSDDVARLYFPEINNFTVDKSIEDPFFKKEFTGWLNEATQGPVEPRFYVRDGKDIKVTVSPFYKNNGNLLGFLMEIKNDTATREYIRKLQEMNKIQKELTIKADAAARAKGNFLSMMSHEIRTPINAIMGMNEMISRQTDNQTILEYTQDVHASVEWLLSLVNDVLDYSKLDSGNMKLVETDFRMEDILRQVELLGSPLAQKKGLKMIFDVADDIPKVMKGDETKLRQVIINLVTNAVKYTDEGTITVSVRFSDNRINVCVKDTGRGIKEESIPYLFEAFSRAEEDKNVGIEGTGLGLAITHDFIELMGGTIEVKSTFGEGSSFIIDVPMKVVLDSSDVLEEEKTIEDNDSKNEAEIISTSFDNKKILVVDDTPVNLKLFTLFLKDTGATVDTAKSGDLALDLCKENHYDLIFIDHIMSGMDGQDTLLAIKNDEASINKETIAIIATANSITDGGAEYKSMGFSDYLCKPYTREQLLEITHRNIS